MQSRLALQIILECLKNSANKDKDIYRYALFKYSICYCTIRVYQSLQQDFKRVPFVRNKCKLHQLPQCACCAVQYYLLTPFCIYTATHTILNCMLGSCSKLMQKSKFYRRIPGNPLPTPSTLDLTYSTKLLVYHYLT